MRQKLIILSFLTLILSVPAHAAEFENSLASLGELSADIPDSPAPKAPDDRIASRNPIENFGIVSRNIYRGARLSEEEHYEYLAGTVGIDTLVSMERFLNDDQALCAKYGMDCPSFPIFLFPGTDSRMDWEMFRAAYRRIIADRAAGKKVYFHCQHGSDRTGAMASAVKIRETACGNRGFDRAALWTSVNGNLERYGFHSVFFSLRSEIRNWIFQFEDHSDWICR